MKPTRLACTFPTAFEAAEEGASISDEMLAKINAYPGVLRARTRENCVVRTMYGLSDEPWKDEIIQVTPDVLKEIAALAVYEPVMFNHDRGHLVGKTAMPTGRLFDASVGKRKGSDAKWIKLWWWAVNTPSVMEDIEAIDGGIIGEVSTAFECQYLSCSICGPKTMLGECDHRLLGKYGEQVCRGNPRKIVRVDEWSLVWKGRVRGTGLGLAASEGDYSDDLKALIARASEAPEVPAEDPLEKLFASTPTGERNHDPLASLFG